jgi:hypothetical protein
MIPRLSERLYAWAKGWLVLLLLAAFILFASLPSPVDPALISKSLDGMVFYTPEQAFSAIASYGDTGRVQMIWIHIADFVLLVLYTSMFCLLISWLFQRGFKPESKMRKLNGLPILGGLFDIMENICVMTMILVYPTRSVAVAWLSTVFTTSKYIMSIPIFLLLLIGLVKATMNRFKVQEAVTTG